ncbi:MAG: hypothetical protein P8Y51_04805 [Campylobacterales bacterium]
MKRFTPTLLLAAVLLQADPLPLDSDLDGVADASDRCPETPFELTVRADGCPAEAPEAPVMLVGGIGMTYTTGTYGGSETVDSLSTDVTAAMYAGNFSLSILSGYYYYGASDPTVSDSDSGGMADTFAGAAYTVALSEKLSLTPGIHVKLATAGEEIGTGETDYGASVYGVYRFSGADVFALYGYTVTGDTKTTKYRDVAFGSAGITLYPVKQGSVSLSYDYAQAYVPDTPALESLGVMGLFTLYDTLSLKANYSLGLSESASDHAFGLMLLKRF